MNDYKINLFDKINSISDEKIRNLSLEAVNSAIKLSQEDISDASIVEGLNRIIDRKASDLAQEM